MTSSVPYALTSYRVASFLFFYLDCDDLSFECEDSWLVGELEVSGRESIELVLDGVSLLLLHVKDDLEDLWGIWRNLSSLSSDLMWGNNVVEDSLMDGSESARSWANLESLTSEVLVDHCSVGSEEDLSLGHLLLDLTEELAVNLGNNSPRLVREVNNHGLLTGLDVQLLGTRDNNLLKLSLEVAVGAYFNVEESLSNLEVEFAW